MGIPSRYLAIIHPANSGAVVAAKMTLAGTAKILFLALCLAETSHSATDEPATSSLRVLQSEMSSTTAVSLDVSSAVTSSYSDTAGNRSCLVLAADSAGFDVTTTLPGSIEVTTSLPESSDYVICDEVVNDTSENDSNTTAGSGSSEERAAPASNSRSAFALINSGSVTKETTDVITRAVNWANLPVCLTGAVLNVFNVAVYVQPAMRSASSTYLAALCSAQLLYLLLFITVIANSVIFGAEALFNYTVLVMGISIGLYALTVLRRITFTLTLVVSFERFVAVAFPLRAKDLRLSSHPGRIAGAVAVLVALIHFRILAKYDIVPLDEDRYTIKTRPFFRDNAAVFTTYSNFWRITLVYVFLTTTIVLNVLTTVFMRRHRKASSKLTTNKDAAKSDKAETQTTIAIIVSSFVFVLFSLPNNVVSVIQDFHPTYGFMKKEHYLYVSVGRFFTTLELISNFVDFLSYMTLSQRFRATFKKLFCRRCTKTKAAKQLPATSGPSGSHSDVTDFSTCAAQP